MDPGTEAAAAPAETGFAPDRIRPDGEPRVYGGDTAGLREAADEVVRKRADRLPAQVEDAIETVNAGIEPEDPSVTKVQYIDGKDRSAGITAEQAGRDYNRYREQKAAELLQDVIAQGQQAAQAEAEAQQPAVEQPTEPTPQELAEVETAVRRHQEIAGYEQARQNLETALVADVLDIYGSGRHEFPDVKTAEDVLKLDPQRRARFDFLDAKVRERQGAVLQLQHQRAAEYRSQFQPWAAQQDALFDQHAPEMRDAEAAEKLRQDAMEAFRAYGYTPAEVTEAYHSNPAMRDYRTQLLIRDAVQWRQAQKRGVSINTQRKPVPPVQRPGTAGMARNGHDVTVERLTEALKNSSGNRALDIAVQLQQAKRAARGADE